MKKRPMIPRSSAQVVNMSEKQKTELLTLLIEKLDDLDCEDFFSTEGWRHFIFEED